MRKSKGQVCVLISGGLDSTCCVAFYLREQFSVVGLFVDYGQLARRREKVAATEICSHYGINFLSCKWTGLEQKNVGLVRGRNALLLVAALVELEPATRVVALGIHSGTPYADCTKEFVNEMQAVYDRYATGALMIGAPFAGWSKKEVWDLSRQLDVPIRLTWSCERGGKKPCGECSSCRDRKALRAS